MVKSVGVVKETHPGERCVAIVPRSLDAFTKAGLTVMIEPSAGAQAGYSDDQYTARGAKPASRAEIFKEAGILIQFRSLGANSEKGRADLGLMRDGQIVIGMGEPLTAFKENSDLADKGVTFFALELMPRITRAQTMDVLSSLATVSGYEAVILAAQALPKMFPMLMTAGGTITPAKAFVLGVGVAGLQAIATAKRLGAVVSAYDVRPAVKDQIISVGAKYISLDVDSGTAEDKGGYARAMDEAFYRRQRELMTEVIREQDVVISTAAVPGKRAPILITKEMVEAMAPGSVIVDIAAVRGGNCELTRPGETVQYRGVTIIGPANFAAMAPYHASQMFSANVVTFLRHLMGFLPLPPQLPVQIEDEIVRETLVTHAGAVIHPRVREAAGLAPFEPATVGVK